MITIEDYLAALEPYATVDIFQNEDKGTWSATGRLRIRAAGAEFKVHSGYRHTSCKAALEALYSRVSDVVVQAKNLKHLEQE